jgi:hypothetical protein
MLLAFTQVLQQRFLLLTPKAWLELSSWKLHTLQGWTSSLVHIMWIIHLCFLPQSTTFLDCCSLKSQRMETLIFIPPKHWFLKCYILPWKIPGHFHEVWEATTIFTIILTYNLSFSLCWHLHWWCKRSGGRIAGGSASIKAKSYDSTSHHCILHCHH